MTASHHRDGRSTARALLVTLTLAASLAGCALPPAAGPPTSPSSSLGSLTASVATAPSSTPTANASTTIDASTGTPAPLDPALTDNGQPAHVPTPEQLRAPIAGAPGREMLHSQAAAILQTPPEATGEIAISAFNEWVTNRSDTVAGESRTYRSSVTTMENNDGTLTNVRCVVEMRGRMPGSSADDWPPLFDVCAGLGYRDADPAAIKTWAVDALHQLQATEPDPTPVFQLTDQNCLHWQVGWAAEVLDETQYLGQVALDVSTGFTPLIPGGGNDAGGGTNPTAYGCPG